MCELEQGERSIVFVRGEDSRDGEEEKGKVGVCWLDIVLER